MKPLGLLLGLALGCVPTKGSTDDPASGPDAQAPSAVDAASAQASAAPQAETPVELDIPLVSGDAEPLARLRGKVVVLMLSSTDLPGWAAFRQHFEARLAELGRSRLVVVAVANDADPQQLQAEWDRDPPPFLLGWDPDGALALRLGVASIPAVFVLDPQGRPRGNVASVEPGGLRQIDAWIDDVVPPN